MKASQDEIAESPEQETRKYQNLRARRLGMSFASYMVTLSIVIYCWLQGMIPFRVVAEFLVACLLINGVFWYLIHTGRNLKFQDPSMTSAQMILSLLPALWVMAFLDAGQARAIFLLIAIVPMLFGILALTTRQFIIVGLWFCGFISGLRGKLRQRNRELGAAMEQIRELVNVDSLTGVYNR